jgi:hypothetical protein
MACHLGDAMRLSLLATFVLSFSVLSFAQHNCPEGFRYVDTISGTGSESNPFNQRMTARLPENATLDESFQQQKVRVTNGKSGATSNMRPQDVPKGILIVAYGKNDKIYEPGWAVSDPELKTVERDANGKVTRYEFGLKLYCNVGSHGANPHFAECSVGADICYKPLR